MRRKTRTILLASNFNIFFYTTFFDLTTTQFVVVMHEKRLFYRAGAGSDSDPSADNLGQEELKKVSIQIKKVYHAHTFSLQYYKMSSFFWKHHFKMSTQVRRRLIKIARRRKKTGSTLDRESTNLPGYNRTCTHIL